MTASIQASAAAATNVTPVSVSVENFNGSDYGFSGASGAVYPATFSGHTIERITGEQSAPCDLRIRLSTASLGETFIRKAVVQTTSGTLRTFINPSYQTDGSSYSEWLWVSQEGQVWSATSPSPRFVLIYR